MMFIHDLFLCEVFNIDPLQFFNIVLRLGFAINSFRFKEQRDDLVLLTTITPIIDLSRSQVFHLTYFQPAFLARCTNGRFLVTIVSGIRKAPEKTELLLVRFTTE